MIKAIIFDFFGVFRTDTYQAWLLKNGYERVGVFAEASMLLDQGKIDSDEFYRQISIAIGRSVTPEEVDDTAILNTEMVTFVRELKRTYRTSLLSNAPSDYIRKLLDEHELNDIFDDIFISGENGYIKPYPEAFQNALKTMGVDAMNVLFVDDNETNVEGAAKQGITSLVFTNVEQFKHDLTSMGIEF